MRFKYMISVFLLGVIVPMVLCQHDSMRSRGNRRPPMRSFSRSSRGPPSRQNDPFGPSGRQNDPFGPPGRRRQPINMDSRRRSSPMRTMPRSRSEIIIEFRNNKRQNEQSRRGFIGQNNRDSPFLENSNQGRFTSRNSISDSRGRMPPNNFNGIDMPRRQTRRGDNQMMSGRQNSRFNGGFPIDGHPDVNNIGLDNHINTHGNGLNDHGQNAFGNDMFPNNNAGISNGRMSSNNRFSHDNHQTNNHIASNSHHASNTRQISNNRQRSTNHQALNHHVSDNHLNSGPVDINLPSEVLGSVNAMPVNTKGGNFATSRNIQNTVSSNNNRHSSGFSGHGHNTAGSSTLNLQNAGISNQMPANINVGITANAHTSGLSGNSGIPIGSVDLGAASSTVNKGGLSIQNVPNGIAGVNTAHISSHNTHQQNGLAVLDQVNSGINQHANIATNTAINPNPNDIHGDLHQLKNLLNEVLTQPNGSNHPQGPSANTQTGVVSKSIQGHPIKQTQNIQSAGHISSQGAATQTNINQGSSGGVHSPVSVSAGSTVGNAINTLDNIIGGATGNLAKATNGHHGHSTNLNSLQPKIEPIEIDYEEILQRAMTNNILNGLSHRG